MIDIPNCSNCDNDGYCTLDNGRRTDLGIDDQGRCINEDDCPEYSDEIIFFFSDKM